MYLDVFRYTKKGKYQVQERNNSGLFLETTAHLPIIWEYPPQKVTFFLCGCFEDELAIFRENEKSAALSFSLNSPEILKLESVEVSLVRNSEKSSHLRKDLEEVVSQEGRSVLV